MGIFKSQIEEVSDPSELISKLNHFIDDYLKNAWIFRGQSDSEWELLPKPFRAKGIMEFFFPGRFEYGHAPNSQDAKFQKNLEFSLVKQFFRIANETGLEIPIESQIVLDDGYASRKMDEWRQNDNWPPSELVDAFALAQHHGLPTRLLDFSFDPLVALYFATEKYFDYKKEGVPKKCAVWCICKKRIEEVGDRFQFYSGQKYLNRNLYRQKGLFIVDRQALKSEKHSLSIFRKENISEQINMYVGEKFKAEEVQIKLEIPSALIPDIKRYLSKRFYNKAFLMPSYDHIAKTILDQRHLYHHFKDKGEEIEYS